jgi:hypothetical protein
MNALALAAFGWLVPGGSYLLMRRYTQFAIFAVLVPLTFLTGLWLQGNCQWPQSAELAGLDGFTALAFRATALAKAMAGAPYLVARVFDGATFLSGRMHEYGTALLMMAGLFNVLSIASALDQRKESKGQ